MNVTHRVARKVTASTVNEELAVQRTLDAIFNARSPRKPKRDWSLHIRKLRAKK